MTTVSEMLGYTALCSIPQVNIQKEIGRRSYIRERDIIDYRMTRLQDSELNTIRTFLPGHPLTTAMDLDPIDESYLLCGHSNGRMSIACLRSDVKYDRETTVNSIDSGVKLKKRVTCCQFYPNSQTVVAAAGADKRVCMWDLEQKMELGSYSFPHDQIYDIAFGNFNTMPLLALANNTNEVYIMNAATMMRFRTLKHPKNERIKCVNFYNNYYYTGSSSGSVYCWDLRMFTQAAERFYPPEKSSEMPIQDIRIAKNHGRLVAMTADRRALVWDLRTNEFKRRIVMSNRPPILDQYSSRFGIADGGNRTWVMMPDGERYVMCGLDNDMAQSNYKLMDGTVVLDGDITACIIRQNYQQVIFSCDNRFVFIWLPKGDEYTERRRDAGPSPTRPR